MIFVTVGTHEQPFDRLIEYMDKLVQNGKVAEEVVIQTGYSTYEPRHCKWQTLFSHDEMAQKIANARIVITHGGPSSFIAPLRIGKVPIVVPRKKELREHVNNHQVDFSRAVSERMGTIIVVEEIENLGRIIEEYGNIVDAMNNGMHSNNIGFCKEFEIIVNKVMEKRTKKQ